MEKPMTKQRMEQYCDLQREIILLQGQILSAEIKGEAFLSDIVQGSGTVPHHAKHNICVTGYGSAAIPRLALRKAHYEAECEEIERFIEAVEDSAMRQLLTRRYIEGRTIKETAKMSGYSEKYASKLITSLFDKAGI